MNSLFIVFDFAMIILMKIVTSPTQVEIYLRSLASYNRTLTLGDRIRKNEKKEKFIERCTPSKITTEGRNNKATSGKTGLV